MEKSKSNLVVKVGVFSAIAFVLQILGSAFPIKVGGFLEIEFSDLPAIIVSFAMGPLAGVLVEFFKNALHCLMSATGFVGEFANFVINGSYVLICGLVYRKLRTKKGAVIALSLGTLALVVAGFFINLYVMLPLYMPSSPLEQKLMLVLGTIIPFNFVKGIVQGVVTMVIYKKLSPLLK